MSVTGYLALYTTLIGWQQYQNLWSLMVGTGLVFIPFIGIVMKCFLEPYESQEPKNAAVIALRRLMIQTIGALLIIEFCCVPTVPLNPQVLHFEPWCEPHAKIATPGHTGTTYDNKFKVPTDVKVPVLWYLIMSIANGFTHAASEGLTCSPINYQTLQNQLDLSNIGDPKLKNETVEFYNDCYVPAYSKYMSGELSANQQAQFTRLEKTYGKDDIGWLGSQAFLQTPGFYDSFSAQKPIEGFLFNSKRDQYEGQVTNHSKWGQPNCQMWWNEPQQGLHAKLVQALPPSFMQAIMHFGEKTALSDIGIRRLIQQSFESGMSESDVLRGYESLNDSNHHSWYAALVGDAGINLHNMTYSPELYLIINALPVIQALLLLAIYALLAVMIPFSSYKLHFIITGAAIIFSIIFWSYLWHLVSYIDNVLISALYADPSNMTSFKRWLLGTANDKLFIHFIIGAMYIALPVLFLILCSWAGLKVSNSIMAAASQMQAPASEAGKTGGAFARSVATQIATKGLSGK